METCTSVYAKIYETIDDDKLQSNRNYIWYFYWKEYI